MSIEDIISYFEMIEKISGFEISIHSIYAAEFFNRNNQIIGRFNTHANNFCSDVKSIKENCSKCILWQSKVNNKVQNGAFCGTCYAGRKEYVIPISDGVETVGFISVGNRKNEYKYSLKEVELLLKPISFHLAKLIRPYINKACGEKTKNTYADILTYITLNYNRKISVREIAKYLFYSESYINHAFKKVSGVSIPEYTNSLRIEKAKSLLLNTDYTIKKIAECVGLDNNYFTKIFTLKAGKSPTQYRIGKGERYPDNFTL